MQKAGGTKVRKTNHGIAVSIHIKGRKRIVVIPDKSDSLPDGTLGAILGPDQTNLGKKGLIEYLNKYGL